MKRDITEVIAGLVFKSSPELTSRLEYQAEALREVECVNPVLGQWIDAHDVKYLLSTFSLGDEDFAARFPTAAKITGPERERLVSTIESHFEHCLHCSLKRGYDLEIDAQIKRACRENNDVLLQLLEEDEESSEEGEHPGMKMAARSSHR